MSLQVGIVGLPNVGKSTLFNALTKQAAKAQNVPFTTIEPNIGVVAVPDERLDKLTKISESVKTTPTTVEFVDIAGLVKNAHKGEGLGNQFLANIREVDAIAHVVRFFDDPGITHVDNNIDPERDIETVNTELILTDLATVEKMRSNQEKKAKGQDKEAMALVSVLVKLEEHLGSGKLASTLSLEEDELMLKKQISLLTDKPVLYIANIDEEQIKQPPEKLVDIVDKYKDVMPISVKIEQELVELPHDERIEFLQEYDLKETGLNRLIRASYTLLNLITFFTSGPTESRAWTVTAGSSAPQAAGQVHSDMEHGFIKAETVSYDDLEKAETYASARSQGKVRDEGKEYIVQDGDIMLFKFSN